VILSGLWNSCRFFADRLKQMLKLGLDHSSANPEKENSESSMTWWIMSGSDKIGELRDGQLEPQSEFWVEYQLIVEDTTFERIKSDANSWYNFDLMLQDAENHKKQVTLYLVATREGDKVAIRLLY